MRILVVKLSSMGDLFHVLPAVHCIKNGLNASLDWITQPEYVELVQCFSDVDRVIPFYRNAFFRKLPDFLRDLKAVDYDLILDFQGLWKSAIAARLARGKKTVGPSFCREGTRLIYSSVAGEPNRNRHAVDEALDTARYLRVPLLEPAFPMLFPKQKIRKPRPRVALFPFSRWPSKNWPAMSFVSLGKELREQMKGSIFLLGGPDDVAGCKKMAGQIPAESLAGQLSLPELGGVLKEMDLVISNDSGPMHMAAAAGVPVLALFGPTESLRTGPYGKNHCVMQSDMQCRPCRGRICRFGDSSCMAVLTPDMVGNTAMQMLE